ncbi:MAG: phospholipid phosphatase [Leptotrichiaceae bacterium]|nr:phospholipid phosphatase [Leptotrichiaceae bacterium]MBP7101253.1 phospholipid phosphatase [Leptotrichiaceae bacterium]
MFFQENGNVKKEETKIKKLGIIMVLFMIFFIFTKVKILPVNIGVVSIIILYIFINFNMTNIYFSSKRVTFKIYIFVLLDIVYFLLGAFNLKSIFFFFIFLFILSYLIIKDEGKIEKPKIANFMIFYVLLKIIFTILLILL